MSEIKCPKCGYIFKMSETDYETIVSQIRNKEFEREVNLNKIQYEKDKQNEIELLRLNLNKELTDTINKKDIEISNLKNELEKNNELIKNSVEKEFANKINELNLEILKLNSKLSLEEANKNLEIEKKLSNKEKEINSLNNMLTLKEKEYLLKEKNIIDSYENKIKDKEEQISYYKDFKARQSTKMIGESLEQHCNNSFNRLRPLFKNAYFEKDNDAKTGSKGDFIFRDFDSDNNEIVSIMFEMKNEADTTTTKHKNEDFLKELDKDRKEKKCEYAVLVSLLEIDNDYYNDGIVDVSHLYDKMYVIRPQFFIPLITLIRNLASKSLKYKKELEHVRLENIDVTHFEENMNTFKEGFSRNYRLASERFKKTIEEIDKTIDHLQKAKENLLKTDDNLRLANNKAEDLTIKKLISNNPTMKKLFDELKVNNVE